MTNEAGLEFDKENKRQKLWFEPGSINCTCCQDIPFCRNIPEEEETDHIVEAVCSKFQSRSAVGLKKYGTSLADNKVTERDKLVHLQEELMDAVNYIEWILHGEYKNDQR